MHAGLKKFLSGISQELWMRGMILEEFDDLTFSVVANCPTPAKNRPAKPFLEVDPPEPLPYL
jgi:hypothetical protein